jgi:uncharacterized DUF497 family protein
MRYTWDPEKDALNRRKHGLRLAEGITALQDPERDFWTDDRFDYGEVRNITLGMGARRVLYVVSTERGEDCTRIISVRKAEDDEIERYDLGRS